MKIKPDDFMKWVNLLPEVGDPIRNARDNLSAQLGEAEDLERRAAALRARVKEGRAALMNRILEQWTQNDIKQAATAAADRGQPLPISFVKDDELRGALRVLDGAMSSQDVLQAFQAGRVIRQHNIFSTATDEERAAMLRRVFDWWNYGAVPVLTRLEDQGRVAQCQ